MNHEAIRKYRFYEFGKKNVKFVPFLVEVEPKKKDPRIFPGCNVQKITDFCEHPISSEIRIFKNLI